MFNVFITTLTYLLLSQIAFASLCRNIGASFDSSPPKHFQKDVAGPNIQQSNATKNLISYLAKLIENQVIDELELSRFAQELTGGRLVSPFALANSYLSPTRLIHHEGLEKYTKGSEIDLKIIQTWALAKIESMQRVSKQRTKVSRDTKESFEEAVYNFVPAGSYRRGEPGEEVDVTLGQGFSMSSTHTTQKQWVDVMGKNPSKQKKRVDSIKFENSDGEHDTMLPNHPVENVNMLSVMVYANRLSLEHGLKPAYDMSEMVLGGSAASGTLFAESGVVKVVAPGGDIYKTEGFRLPMDAEWEYVIKNLGADNDLYHFGKDVNMLSQFAWYAENSGARTHAVALLRPIVVEGGRFYDLQGNVKDMIYDYYGPTSGGFNPKGPVYEVYRRVRGGSGVDGTSTMRSGRNDDGIMDGSREAWVGFRLVKTER